MFTYTVKATINNHFEVQFTVKADNCKDAIKLVKQEKSIKANNDVWLRVFQPGCAIADLAARKSCGHWKNY